MSNGNGAGQQQQGFYTWQGLGTLAGQAGAVSLVTGVLSNVFDWKFPEYFVLLLGIVVSMGVGLVVQKFSLTASLKASPLWLLNGFLVYTTVFGAARVTGGPKEGPKENERRTTQARTAAEPLANRLSQLATSRSTPAIKDAAREARALENCLSTTPAGDCAAKHSIDSIITKVEQGGAPPKTVQDIKSLAEVANQKVTAGGHDVGFSRLANMALQPAFQGSPCEKAAEHWKGAWLGESNDTKSWIVFRTAHEDSQGCVVVLEFHNYEKNSQGSQSNRSTYDGCIRGTVMGDTLTGTWKGRPGVGGDITLTVTSDGATFNGTYHHVSEPGKDLPWTGTRKSSDSSGAPSGEFGAPAQPCE